MRAQRLLHARAHLQAGEQKGNIAPPSAGSAHPKGLRTWLALPSRQPHTTCRAAPRPATTLPAVAAAPAGRCCPAVQMQAAAQPPAAAARCLPAQRDPGAAKAPSLPSLLSSQRVHSLARVSGLQQGAGQERARLALPLQREPRRQGGGCCGSSGPTG